METLSAKLEDVGESAIVARRAPPPAEPAVQAEATLGTTASRRSGSALPASPSGNVNGARTRSRTNIGSVASGARRIVEHAPSVPCNHPRRLQRHRPGQRTESSSIGRIPVASKARQCILASGQPSPSGPIRVPDSWPRSCQTVPRSPIESRASGMERLEMSSVAPPPGAYDRPSAGVANRCPIPPPPPFCPREVARPLRRKACPK